MSKKIPFLQMFSMLQRWPELAQAVERWLIVSAAIDRTSRSAKVTVEGAAGAGANLVLQVEEAIAKAYGLVSVKLDCLSDMKPEKPAETPEPAIRWMRPAAAACSSFSRGMPFTAADCWPEVRMV